MGQTLGHRVKAKFSKNKLVGEGTKDVSAFRVSQIRLKFNGHSIGKIQSVGW